MSSEGQIIPDEPGHLVGLALVSDPAQVVHGGPDGQPSRYAAGDLTGLGIIERSDRISAPAWVPSMATA
ncbi:hypothetical protein GHK86_09030 [Acidimicrobiaceae bacterium USS-CC1]|uniref:Uncharacterized protein n=1 Tax=Acidiferrimicrobium australe TaxID=2664430 RepID=A0ABW9QSQ6_9ACTN|nr:hypothetical protein [Acidiferrimicrobium australe]